MPPLNPLELSEIAELVATYLEGKDLGTCVCVSKTWRDMFLRYRWQVVHVEVPDGFKSSDAPAYIGPHRTDIYNHRHWIQDLTLVNMFAELDVCQYPNLRRLDIRINSNSPSSKDISMDPIIMAPSLVDLRLHGVDLPPSFWETLSTHPHIKHLDLSCMRLKIDDTPGLWRTCMKLESLRINIRFNDGGIPRNAVFDRMRSLHMEGIDSARNPEQLDLILRCPMLESLDWFIFELPEIEERFTDCLWPQLKKLHVMATRITDKESALFLNGVGSGLGGIEDLKLGFCELGTQASKALKVHASTLVRVVFPSVMVSDHSITSELLCLCPRLEVLDTQNVFAKEIAERGPWVCQRLRELEICFCFRESEQDLHQLVYERLSTLIQLERLTIRHPYPSNIEGDQGLVFRLDCGLGCLASLQQLTYFCISTTHKSPLGMEEALWMVENWRKLRRIGGFLKTDEEVKAQLVSLFESHGIAVH